jgi:hypothetical protein
MGLLKTVPLCGQEGSVKLHYKEAKDLQCEGYFSTTLYYRSDKPFTDTDYYHGIKIYATFLNADENFHDVGMIIYTDANSYPLLERHFGDFPKVVIAVVAWPRFAVSKTVLEGTILRCMRYHATALFHGSWIAVRDADTLFAYEINNVLLKVGRHRTIEKRPNATVLMSKLISMIASWENIFISIWLRAGDKIVISTSDKYLASWHKQFPFTYVPKPLPAEATATNKDYLNVYHQSHIKRMLEEGDRPTFGVLFDAPLGVYAGFTNFAATSPKGIWSTCCKYLKEHYSMVDDVELTKKRIISNTYSSIGAIGKDERMLIFAVMPKYFDDVYFVHIDYYGGLEVGENIFSPSRSRTPALKYLEIDSSYTTDIEPVQTLLLAPRYARNIYDLPYVDVHETADEFVHTVDGTMNEHFRKIFGLMLKEYERFTDAAQIYGQTTLEEFGEAITRNGEVRVPALKNVVYRPIEVIKPRVFVRTRKASTPPNSKANRAEAKRKTKSKKSRRSEKLNSSPTNNSAHASNNNTRNTNSR